MTKGQEHSRSAPIEDEVAALERAAVEAEDRAAAARVAWDRLTSAQAADRRRQAEPLRARAAELRTTLAALDAELQARLDRLLVDARRVYVEQVRPAGDSLVLTVGTAAALDGRGWGERAEVFARWFSRNLAAWEERTRWRLE
ncbi:MAG: hypothetical protein IT293_11370 [Deltaproteobacteria bacterium]|nr:hypothetical protein [Deltaproteobacteria bacterium]